MTRWPNDPATKWPDTVAPCMHYSHYSHCYSRALTTLISRTTLMPVKTVHFRHRNRLVSYCSTCSMLCTSQQFYSVCYEGSFVITRFCSQYHSRCSSISLRVTTWSAVAHLGLRGSIVDVTTAVCDVWNIFAFFLVELCLANCWSTTASSKRRGILLFCCTNDEN